MEWLGKIKRNEYFFRGSNSQFVHFLPSQLGSTRSKFFCLGVAPILEGFIVQKSKQEITKAVSLCKNGRKI